jgi:general secretion pathway protein B
MSFILDALKKSEAERQRQAGPALLEMRIVRPTRRLPVWAIAIGVLLVVCVVALAWVALRRGGSSAATPATAATANPAAGAPAGTNANTNANTMPATPGAAMANAPAMNAPAVNSTGTSAPSAAGVAPLSAGAQAPASASEAQSAAEGDDNPADAAPAEAPSAGVARERTDTRGLRNYSELGGNMPELRLDLHVYAPKPAERYAFINMHKVREGEVTAEGVMVKEITPDGVVLEYHGTEFLLGR